MRRRRLRWGRLALILFPFICVLPFLFLGKCIRFTIINGAQSITHAKVDVREVDVDYIPFSLSIRGVAVTNPQKPMTNLFEFNEARITLPFIPLLKRQLIIDEIVLDGVAVQTLRGVSGELPKYAADLEARKEKSSVVKKAVDAVKNSDWVQERQDATEGLGEDSAKIVTEISREMDASLKKNQAELARMTRKWEKKNLGKKYDADVARIVGRLKDLESKSYSNVASVTNGLAQLKTVETQLSKLKKDLTSSQTDFNRDYVRLKRNSADFSTLALKGYKEGLRTIKSDAISATSLVNLYLLQPVRDMLPQYIALYQRFVEWKTKRNDSTDTDTNQTGPPKLWIKQIVLTGDGKNGQQIRGEVRHLSSDQYYIGEPFVVDLRGNKVLSKNGSFVLKMNQDASQNGFPISLSGNAQNMPIYKWNLYRERGKTVRILSGSSKVFFKSALLPAGRIVGTVTAYGRELDFYTDGFDETNSIEGIMIDVLKETDSAKVTAQISGRITKPDVSISSDIGDRLGKGLNNMVQSLLNEERRMLKKRLDVLSNSHRRAWQNQLKSKFGGIEKEIDAVSSRVKGLGSNLSSTRSSINKKLEAAQKEAAEKAAQSALKSLPNLNL